MRRSSVRQMLVRISVAALLILALASASAKINLSAHNDVRATATATALHDSQCVSIVPKAWGQYRGGSAQSGLSFEDSDGTLRFVTNLPCGSVPIVALEIRRTGNSN